MEKKRVTEEHGSWHIMLKEPTEKQIDQIAQRTDVAAVSHYDALNVDLSDDYTIQGKTCVIAGGDHSILTEIYEDLTEGQYPVKENEILLSNGAKELLSVNIGDVITMHTPAGDFDYRISGFGGDVTITTDADVVGTFLSWDSFQSLAKAEESRLEPVCFVRFNENINIRRAISELRQTYGFTDEILSENTALLGITGSSSDSYIMGSEMCIRDRSYSCHPVCSGSGSRSLYDRGKSEQQNRRENTVFWNAPMYWGEQDPGYAHSQTGSSLLV